MDPNLGSYDKFYTEDVFINIMLKIVTKHKLTSLNYFYIRLCSSYNEPMRGTDHHYSTLLGELRKIPDDQLAQIKLLYKWCIEERPAGIRQRFEGLRKSYEYTLQNRLYE